MSKARIDADDERAQQRDLIRRLLTEPDHDGTALTELSRRTGVPAATLASWVERLRREDETEPPRASVRESAGFVELVASEQSVVADESLSRFEIVLKGQRRVVIPAEFDDGALVRLVRVLESC